MSKPLPRPLEPAPDWAEARQPHRRRVPTVIMVPVSGTEYELEILGPSAVRIIPLGGALPWSRLVALGLVSDN